MAENTGRKRAASPRRGKSTQTKAQAEFERHKAEAAAAANTISASAANASSSTPAGPGAMPVMTGGGPAWAFPPSFAMLPPQTGMTQPAMTQATGSAASLGGQLSTTLRLGVDLLNATLAGGLRVLDGVHGASYGYGDPYATHCAPHGCGCGAGCGGYDCCCAFGQHDCCHPSVGSCC